MKKLQKKRVICRALTAAMALTIIALSLLSVGCASRKPPKLEDVRDRIEWLLDNSYEINEIIWGEGLPTHKFDSEYDKAHKLYDHENFDGYEYVKEDCKYQTVNSIKDEAEMIYSKNYLDGIYQQLFEGYTIDNQHFNLARYIEKQNGFMAYSRTENLMNGRRMYDFSTLEIVEPSRHDYINVSVVSYLSSSPGDKTTETFSFIFEDGNWFLDSPAF